MIINFPAMPTAIRVDPGVIFISLELGKATWLITSLSPGSENMSRHCVAGGDIGGLFTCFAGLRDKAQARMGKLYPLVVIQEVGLDGFWIDRVLNRENWIESHVVDTASIAVPRRRRRAKTHRIDGETLVRTLMAWKRGEPRACSMIRIPTPENEDRRRISRERKTLIAERIEHSNRIKGLLFSQGIRDYAPLRRDRRKRLDELRTGDGRVLPVRIKAQISRELDRLELLLAQIKAVENERAERIDRPRAGVSKAGNPRLRVTMVQLVWLWLRHQPRSNLAIWFQERVMRNGGRFRKSAIVALARKLLVALWKYATAGIVIEGAATKSA